MRVSLSIAALLCLAHSLGAAELSVAHRQGAGLGLSLLIAADVDDGSSINEIRVKLPNRLRRDARLGKAPQGWSLTQQGSDARVSGPPAAGLVRIRLDIGDNQPPAELEISVLSGGAVAAREKIRPATTERQPLSSALEDFAILPAVIEPGEQIEFSAIDLARTPPEGQWTVAGVLAAAGSQGRFTVRIPSDMAPGAAVSAAYVDTWGETVVETPTAQAITVAAPPEFPEPTPRVTGCSRLTFAGQFACVCGDFPEGAQTQLTLDGQPLGQPLSASRRVLHYRLAADVAPGAHIVSGSPEDGFSPSDQAMLIALRMSGSIDQSALIRGESTEMRIQVDGAAEPLVLDLENRTPEIISIEGGVRQSIEISGDAPITRKVDALRRGDFDIAYSTAAASCPCREVQEISRTPDGYIPRRVAASIPNAAPAVLLAAAQAIAATFALNVIEATPLNTAAAGLAVFEIPDARTVPAVVALLNADPRLNFAQTDFVYDTYGQITAVAPEPYEALSYGARLTGADRIRGFVDGQGVRVAIIDTGVDAKQVDLVDQLAESRDFTGLGFSADMHGTQVAGILSAKPGNGAGISGVAPGATVLALKACQPSSAQSVRARCWSSALVKGLDYAAGQRVDIINMSVGGRREDRLLQLGVETAVNSGSAVVAAAGNEGPNGPPSYPAALDGVVAVTAIDARQQLYRYATQGAFVDLSAPGVEIISTAPGNQFPVCSGTSFATAHVAGALALLRQASPASTAAALVAALRSTAQDLGPGGRDAQFGHGLINACAALRVLSPQAPACE
jgi:hypothetical protein